MALPISIDTTFEPPPALPGMIADSMFTDKVVVPCGAAPQPFGTVVASVPATGISVLPIGANPIEGIAIMDHQVAGAATATGATQDGYRQYNRMSVMRRGRIWGLASGACGKDAVAKYDPATGMFADAGTGTLPNAKFLSAAVSIPGLASGEAAVSIVLVELHSPAV